MDRGAWQASVHRVEKRRIRLSTRTCMCILVKGLELKKIELSIVPEVNNGVQALVDWSHEGQHHYSIFHLGEGLSSSIILAWKDPMDRGAWWVTVHRVAKSWTQLSEHTQEVVVSRHFFPISMAFWNAWSILWGVVYLQIYMCSCWLLWNCTVGILRYEGLLSNFSSNHNFNESNHSGIFFTTFTFYVWTLYERKQEK